MKINVSKTDEVQRALDELQSLVRVRTAQAEDVLWAADRAEEHLERFGIPKSKRKGAHFTYMVGFGGRIPNSYNGTPESTTFVIERGTESWFFVEYRRSQARAHIELIWSNVRAWESDIFHAAQNA